MYSIAEIVKIMGGRLQQSGASGPVAHLVYDSRKITFALVVGFVHLLGGIAAAFLIPAPVWFIALDLVIAYVPMAWLGGKFVSRDS